MIIKDVKLEWLTFSERSNSRFKEQRSGDGKIWQTIASANGTPAASNTYKVYDNSSLSGVNYYVVKEYDVDGHTYQSEIKILKMTDVKSIISVFPNPSRRE